MRKASRRRDPARNSPRNSVTIAESVRGRLLGAGGGRGWSWGREGGGAAAIASSALRLSNEGDPKPIEIGSVGSHPETATTHLGEPLRRSPTGPPQRTKGASQPHWGQRRGAPPQRWLVGGS